MTSRSKISLALLVIVTLAASTAAGYDWKQKVTYGNDPSRSDSTSSRSYYVARPYYEASQWASSYEPTQIESRRAYSYEPAATPSFKVNDTIVITAASANMKVGDRVVATVPRGQRITVSSVEGPWVGTTIDQNGQHIGGWFQASDFTTANGDSTACR